MVRKHEATKQEKNARNENQTKQDKQFSHQLLPGAVAGLTGGELEAVLSSQGTLYNSDL